MIVRRVRIMAIDMKTSKSSDLEVKIKINNNSNKSVK